jgi:hypothetical protein
MSHQNVTKRHLEHAAETETSPFYSLFYSLIYSLYLRIAKIYESKTNDYHVQIQESISELLSSIGYNITSLVASNLKATNLPVPAAPSSPPAPQHNTLPHSLSRAAHSAAGNISQAAPRGVDDDKLSKALTLYATGWDRVAIARFDQDAAIQDNFLHPWQTTLNASIVAMKARQAVWVSRFELDAAKQMYFFSFCFSIYVLLTLSSDLKMLALLNKNRLKVNDTQFRRLLNNR